MVMIQREACSVRAFFKRLVTAIIAVEFE